MKTNYLLQPKKRKSKKEIISVFVVVFFFVVLYLFHAFAPSLMSGFFTAFARPVWKSQQFAALHFPSLTSYFQSKQVLQAENARLQDEIETARLKMISYDLLAKENADLKELLGRKAADDRVLASILSRPPATLYDTFILDVGADHGIQKGYKVVATGNVVMGEIIEVSAESSKAKLYSSPGEKIDVVVGNNKTIVSALGKGNGNFEIKLPKDVTVVSGDVISLPHINIEVFGSVEAIETRPSDSFQYVLFKSPVNINELTWVEVEKAVK